MVSERTIQRLILYRKILSTLKQDGVPNIFSHKLAEIAASTPAQVRRDLMAVGYSGSPVHGYKVEELMLSINNFLNPPEVQNVALIGLGNLGKAILDYCHERNPNLKITASFDSNPEKINRYSHGAYCYDITELEKVIIEKSIEVALITVPADQAQKIAERLVESGVKGILNYSPVGLVLPEEIYVENRDMLLALEKVAFFASKLKEYEEETN